MAFPRSCLPPDGPFDYEAAERRVEIGRQIDRIRAKVKGLSVNEYLGRFYLGVSEEIDIEDIEREKAREEILNNNAKN